MRCYPERISFDDYLAVYQCIKRRDYDTKRLQVTTKQGEMTLYYCNGGRERG